MEYPWQMYGRTVQIFRYRVTWTEEAPDEGEGPEEQEEYCTTLESAERLAERTGGEIETLDTTEYEWMEGIEADTRDESIEIFRRGRAAWEAEQQKLTPEELIAMLEEAMCDIDAAAEERLAAMEEALCELDNLISGGGEADE